MPPTVALLPVTCRRYAASAGARVCRKMNQVIRDGTEVDVIVSACVTWHTLDGTLVRRALSRTCVRPDRRREAGEEDNHDDNRDIRMPLCHNPDPSRRFSSFRRHFSTCVRVPRGAAHERAVERAPERERRISRGSTVSISAAATAQAQTTIRTILCRYRCIDTRRQPLSRPPRRDSPPPPSLRLPFT